MVGYVSNIIPNPRSATTNTIANVITLKNFEALVCATMLVGIKLHPMLSNESTANLSTFIVPLLQCNCINCSSIYKITSIITFFNIPRENLIKKKK